MKIINKVIKFLIFSDLCLVAAGGLITPIFAVFLTDNINGGNVKVAGYAAAIYLITKSLAEIPLAQYLDKHAGEKDDLAFIIFGNFLITLAIFSYIKASLPWHIYVIEAVYALGAAFNFPGYNAIFSRHLKKGKEALTWTIDASLVEIGTGIAGAVGGIIVFRYGFNCLFICGAVFSFISALLPILINDDLYDSNGKCGRKKAKA